MDRAAHHSNLRRWLEHPVAGLVVGGSTGEAPLLDEVELLRLVEWSRQAAPSGRRVIAGTGAESTRQTVRLCREAARAGADAVLVRPPAYYRDRMNREALRAHFTAVADSSPVPVILYRIPRYVPVELEPELVGELARHDNVAGIKDSSGSIRILGALVEACGREAAVLVGAGTLLYGGLEVGAAGGVLAVGLVAPAICCRLISAWRDGETAAAGSLQERIGPLHRGVVGRHGVAGVKAALDRLGFEGGPVRSPLRPLGEAAGREIAGALQRAGPALRGASESGSAPEAGSDPAAAVRTPGRPERASSASDD